MPRAARKSVSRSSSRNSSRTNCRKRCSPRDTVLSLVREAFQCTARSSRGSSYVTDSPQPRVVEEKMSAESKASKMVDQEEKKKPDGAELTDLVSQKPSSLIMNGMRYIMMPLHLFNLCVRGPASAPSLEAAEKKISPKSTEEIKLEDSLDLESENSTPKNISSSPKSSKILPSSISSSNSCVAAEPIASSFVSPSRIPSLPTVDTPPSIHKKTIRRRIFEEESSEDDSSDEMVTAREHFEDDSSSDQWSSARSVQSINMSIERIIEKISSNCLTNSSSAEEPMDVSIEESLLRANNAKNSIEIRSSSSASEDYNSISSHSSVDREIAGIFQRASSSSDEEDMSHLNGRRNNPFVSRSSRRNGFREEISDAAIRKKRTVCQYDRMGRRKTGSDSSRSSEDYLRKNIRFMENREANNQTDSAYSDEDVEMNSINESIMHRLQSAHAMSLQESVVEWMDQDLEYVADTEDSNDGSPLPGRARIASFGSESSTNTDQGFVEDNERKGCWKKNWGTFEGRVFPEEEETSGYWSTNAGIDIINRHFHTATETTPANLDAVSGFEIRIRGEEIVRKKTGSPLSAAWKDISGVDTSIEGPLPVTAEAIADFCKLEQSRRALSRFPEDSQLPVGDSCDCGNPNCIYLPLGRPEDFSNINWDSNYSRRTSSSIRDIYNGYPKAAFDED